MPYGISKEHGGDNPQNTRWMENCVKKVMKTGKDKASAISICKAQFKKTRKKENK
jgi:hypothetical protein